MSTHSLTSRRQRIAIWIIAIVMIVGTVAGLIFMVWATQDSRIDPSTIAQDEYLEQLQQQQEEYEKQAAEARKKLRAIEGYEDKVTSFDANSSTTLAGRPMARSLIVQNPMVKTLSHRCLPCPA